MEKRFKSYSDYLLKKFNARVYKITLDGGFTCPNRDGTISNKGCIFCDNTGSFSSSHDKNLSIENQIAQGISDLTKRHKAQKFISYFQSYTNTYKPLNELKKIYDSAFCDDKIVGISIGTRPDCVDSAKLDLIASYKNPLIEYGLQTIHDKTLNFINRGHSYKTFEDAYFETKKRGIEVCCHVILGLPYETRDMMIETAKRLAELRVDGVKIHCLTVLKDTQLEKMDVSLLSEDEYCSLVCDFLEHLHPDTKIHRLAGSGLRTLTIAPKWINQKFHTQNLIDKILWQRDSFQGKYWEKP